MTRPGRAAPGRATLAGRAVLVAAVLMLGVSACAPVPGNGEPGAPKSVAVRSYPGLPPTAQGTGPIGGEPTVMWVESGSVFAVTTWGSSSCPLVPIELSEVAADAVEISFADSPGEVCTADMAPTSHEFSLPVSVTERPVMIIITYQAREGVEALLLD